MAPGRTLEAVDVTTRDELLAPAALDLLEARACTPGCLLALDRPLEDCTCRCGGRWHGTLVWACALEWSGYSRADVRRPA